MSCLPLSPEPLAATAMGSPPAVILAPVVIEKALPVGPRFIQCSPGCVEVDRSSSGKELPEFIEHRLDGGLLGPNACEDLIAKLDRPQRKLCLCRVWLRRRVHLALHRRQRGGSV